MTLVAVATLCKYGLLATTLFTFQDYCCDNEHLHVRCPRGSVISVRWAQYGRLETSANNDLCPDMTWQPSPGQHDDDKGLLRPTPRTDWVARTTVAVDSSPIITMATSYRKQNASTCLATSSLQVVMALCQDQQQCRIEVNHQLFRQDPCPHLGKYLEVAYQCKPAEIRTLVACKGEVLNLRCPKARVIALQWATYGYSSEASQNKCRSQSAYDTECEAPCSLPIVARTCQGRQRCSLAADESAFGEPCRRGTSEYLTVTYACVAERSLAELPGKLLTAIEPDECRSAVTSLMAISGLPVAVSATKASFTDEVSSQSGSLVAETVQPGVAAVVRRFANTFVSDWIGICRYISDNLEKVILYAVVGLCFGAICVLFVVIVKLIAIIARSRRLLRSVAIQNATSAHKQPSQNPNGLSTGQGQTPAEPSFVDSGRGSPSLVTSGGALRRSTPELSRRPPPPGTTPGVKASRQRRRLSPFEFSPTSPAVNNAGSGPTNAMGALNSGTPGGVHLPPGPDSPVFVHVESPRESPLLGRAPPMRDGISSDSNGPSPPPRTDASIAAVSSRSALRSAVFTNDIGQLRKWFRPPSSGSSVAASRTDLQREDSPVWVRRSVAADEVPPSTGRQARRIPAMTVAGPPAEFQTRAEVRPESTPAWRRRAVDDGELSNDVDDMTVVVPVMPAASPDLPEPLEPPFWIQYEFDAALAPFLTTTTSEGVDNRPTSMTSSFDVQPPPRGGVSSRSYSPQYQPVSAGTLSSSTRTRNYSSSSTPSVSPASTMPLRSNHHHLETVSTVPRSVGSILGTRRAGAVYPSSASLGPVPSLMIDDRSLVASGPIPSFSVGTVASPSSGASTHFDVVDDSAPTLTRSYSNPYRQDSYQPMERRSVPGRDPSSAGPHRRSVRSSSGRRRRHLLRFE